MALPTVYRHCGDPHGSYSDIVVYIMIMYSYILYNHTTIYIIQSKDIIKLILALEGDIICCAKYIILLL